MEREAEIITAAVDAAHNLPSTKNGRLKFYDKCLA